MIDMAPNSSIMAGGNRACTACRAIKSKCRPDPGNASAPCTRCQRLQLVCEYTRKKPGRKANSRVMTPPPTAREVEAPSFTVTPDAFDRSDRAFSVGHSTDGVPAVNAYHALSTTSMMSHDDGRLPMYGNGNGQSSSLVGTGSQAFITRPDEIAATQNQAEVQSDVRAETQHVVTSAFPPDPSSSNDHSNVVLDVTDYLDPALPNAQTTSPPPSQSRWTPLRGGIGQPMAFHDDPALLNLVSELEMRDLVDSYYEHLNPVISLLDPTLHILSVIRRESCILLTAVLAVSAKFFRPTIYPLLLSHAQAILNRAMASGDCNLGIVQALLLLIHWKTPTDRSAWVKLGFGMRLGYQLGLHVVRKTALPADETAARRIRAAERTWFVLSCIDRAYSELFRLPPTIRLDELASPEGWARERIDLQSMDDLHLASAVDMASGQMMWAAFRQDRRKLPTEYQLSFLRDLYARYSQHKQHWFPEDRSRRVFTDRIHRILSWFDINHLFTLKYGILGCSPSSCSANLIQECLVLAEEFAEQTDLIGHDGTLLYMQDTSATHLSNFGMVSYRRKLLNASLRKSYNACRRVAAGDEDTSTAFIARFLQRVLTAIAVESRRGSRAASPSLPIALPGTIQFDNLLNELDTVAPAQDDFMRIASMPIDGSHDLDDQYWTSLFQSVPFYLRDGL